MGRTASPVFLRAALAVAVLLAVLAALLRAGAWQPGPTAGSGERGVSGSAVRLQHGSQALHHWWDRLLDG